MLLFLQGKKRPDGDHGVDEDDDQIIAYSVYEYTIGRLPMPDGDCCQIFTRCRVSWAWLILKMEFRTIPLIWLILLDWKKNANYPKQVGSSSSRRKLARGGGARDSIWNLNVSLEMDTVINLK